MFAQGKDREWGWKDGRGAPGGNGSVLYCDYSVVIWVHTLLKLIELYPLNECLLYVGKLYFKKIAFKVRK